MTVTARSHAQIAFAMTGSYAMGSNAVSVTVADVNGDGRPDLLVGNAGLLILTNNGNGVFASNAFFANINYPITVADINGDGKPDLIASDGAFGAGHIIVFTNNGAGGYVSNAVYSVGSVPGRPLVADINHDGLPDIVCANQAADTLSVLTNNGQGGFSLASSPATPSNGGPVSPVAVDINNDGKITLVCANGTGGIGGNSCDSTLSVITNAGYGIFHLAYKLNVGVCPGFLVAADVNGDGKVDLACLNSADNTLSVLTNNGNGGFGSSATLPVGRSPIGLVAADLSGDGLPDFVYESLYGGSVSVLTNNGSGALGSSVTLTPTRLGGFIVADLNADGRKDLVCVNDGLGFGPVYTSRSSFSVYLSTPALTSKVVASNLILSWPSGWTNWTLLQAADLAATNWTSYGGVIQDDGTTKQATNSITAGDSFFRLGHP